MKNALILFSTIFLFATAIFAQSEPVLYIEVENGKTFNLKKVDLEKFPRREVKAKAHDEKELIYSGYNISDILLSAGAKLGKGEMRGNELASYVLVEAADGYRAIFAIAELAPEFTDKAILLADTRDGKPLSKEEGAWQIIVPEEKKHGRWVRQVSKVKLKKIDSGRKEKNENK